MRADGQEGQCARKVFEGDILMSSEDPKYSMAEIESAFFNHDSDVELTITAHEERRRQWKSFQKDLMMRHGKGCCSQDIVTEYSCKTRIWCCAAFVVIAILFFLLSDFAYQSSLYVSSIYLAFLGGYCIYMTVVAASEM